MSAVETFASYEEIPFLQACRRAEEIDLLGARARGAVLGFVEVMDRLAGLGISYHTQAVLCPGINDGPALDRAIEEIAQRHPHARSLSLVPVGLTGVGKHPEYLRRHRADEAAAIVARAEPYRRRFRASFGRSWLYPSDELYLMGGARVPSARVRQDEQRIGSRSLRPGAISSAATANPALVARSACRIRPISSSSLTRRIRFSA